MQPKPKILCVFLLGQAYRSIFRMWVASFKQVFDSSLFFITKAKLQLS